MEPTIENRLSPKGADLFRELVDQILSDSPEHNRIDEHEEVLEAIVQAFEKHR